MSSKKEVHFFDKESNFKNNVDYSKYHSFFQEADRETKLFGEATPIYMYWNESMKRIFEYNKEMKIIITLRNPIERAYSHWNMQRNRNYDSLSFIEALRREKERLKEVAPLQQRKHSYIDRGF